MPPRISVLLPCFNQGAFLDEAIASVQAQTLEDFEIIVVDDGSADPATVEKLRRFEAPRTVVLRTTNHGLPGARNYAAAHARGAVFCALDADDRLAPSWFEQGVALLDQRPDVAFVSHWLETFGDEAWTWRPERCDLPALLARNVVNGAALVRREAMEAVGGYDESMREGCEDWDLWLRMVQRGFAGAIIPEVLFYYRRHAGSMSRAMLDETAYRRPLEMLVQKHREAYRTHLLDVLLAKEADALGLTREMAKLERDRLVTLEPALRRAREERDGLAEKVGRAEVVRAREEQHDRLAWKTAELEREVADLRGSWSWRLTAPLRKLFGLLAAGTR